MNATGGTQSLRRGLDLMRLVVAHHADGITLRDLVAASSLERSTAYRLVACLVEEGYVERDPGTRRYRLGMAAMQLGLVAMDRAPLVEMSRLAMRRLARVSGDTVFLIVRQGDYALCLHREAGQFPIKTLTIDVGERRLLGIGAGGQAIMAELSNEEVAVIYNRNARKYSEARIELSDLLSSAASTRRKGYAAMEDLISVGVAGIGCAFKVSSSTIASISIAAITSRLTVKRRKELADLIRQECLQLAG
ncbi:MAG: IclR family transcriptional regulator [Microbacteriaceae bacterium]|nr:MAG: IclR family transcriptional regulator [Microbacteriaceae bacterium]